MKTQDWSRESRFHKACPNINDKSPWWLQEALYRCQSKELAPTSPKFLRKVSRAENYATGILIEPRQVRLLPLWIAAMEMVPEEKFYIPAGLRIWQQNEEKYPKKMGPLELSRGGEGGGVAGGRFESQS